MTEKIFEVKIASVANMPEGVRRDVIKKVSQSPVEFQKKFQGFAKIIYVTNSPKSIKSIDPIAGTIIDYFKSAQVAGVNIPVF